MSADPIYTPHELLSSQSGVVGKDELFSFSSLEFSDSEEEEEEEEEEEGSHYEEEEEVDVSSEVTQYNDGGGDEYERDADDFNVSNLRDSGELAITHRLCPQFFCFG
jgi:hypothetical protein